MNDREILVCLKYLVSKKISRVNEQLQLLNTNLLLTKPVRCIKIRQSFQKLLVLDTQELVSSQHKESLHLGPSQLGASLITFSSAS